MVLESTQPSIKEYRELTLRVKAAERRTSHPSAVAVYMWTLASITPWAFMACNGDNFTLLYYYYYYYFYYYYYYYYYYFYYVISSMLTLV